MTGAGVDQLTGVRVSTAQNAVVHRAPGSRAANRSSAVERRAGTGLFEQQRPARAAQLSHHRRGGQAVADTVADDQRDAPVVEVDDVIPVAADLQRAGRRLVSNREAAGRLAGPRIACCSARAVSRCWSSW